MKISERTLRISAASLLALVMVGASYLLSGPNFLTSKSASAESTEELLKAYASKDTDSDGLPDWEEALYGTDPQKAVSNSFGIPDGQAAKEGKLTPDALASQLPSADQGNTKLTDADFGGVPAPAPGSITEQFSKEFFQQFVEASNGQPMDDATQQKLVQNLLQEISQKTAATLSSKYTLVFVHTNPSIDILSYAGSVETVLKTNEVNEGKGDPLELMQSSLISNDSGAQASLEQLADAYGNIRDGLLAISVPPNLRDAHLELIRSFDSLQKTTALVSHYQNDPVGTLGALALYQTSFKGVADGVTTLATALLAQGEPAPGAPGAYLVSAARLTH